jgi:acyl-CoA synthetase (AMP-forming)/AMP-acid ligase II
MEIRILADSAKFPSAVDGEILVRSARSDRLARLELDGDGWFHTGDVGHLDADGILYIAGRLTERMIVGGFNVYPAEIENAARESDLVRDIAVVALADSRLGEKPVACVVWAGEADAKQLEQEMRQRLPAYKVPRRFLAVSAVPLTPRGKVDRRRCVEIAVADMANTAEHEQD